MTLVSKIPLKAFLYANLAMGILVALTNGVAIALVLTGHGGTVADRVPEMAAWFTGGVLLLVAGAYGLLSTADLAVLRFQLVVVIALVIAIAARAVLALTRASAVDAQMVWGLGVFSILVVYVVGLVSRLFDDDRYRWFRIATTWIAIPLAVLLDVAMAFRG